MGWGFERERERERECMREREREKREREREVKSATGPLRLHVHESLKGGRGEQAGLGQGPWGYSLMALCIVCAWSVPDGGGYNCAKRTKGDESLRLR